MTVGMGVPVVMAVRMGMSHGKTLYYNITGVHGPNRCEWLREDDEQHGGRRE
jgi:hypothetical protein